MTTLALARDLDGVTPAARLGALIVLATAVAFARGPLGLALAALLALVAILIARVPMAALWRRLRHVEGFLLVLLIIVPLTVPGTPVAQFGPLTVTQEGLMRAGVIALKVNAAVLIMTALIGSLEPARLPVALAGLRVPPRLVALFGFTVRFVALMREEADRLREALRVRAFVPRLGARTIATYGHLAALIVLRAYDRAARIDEAMRCRGFSGRLPRATPAPWRRSDFGFLSASALAALIVGVASW